MINQKIIFFLILFFLVACNGNYSGNERDFKKSLKFQAKSFVAVGDAGSIITSNDGILWDSITSGTINFLNGVSFVDNTLVVVDNDGITYEIVAPFGNNSPVTEVLSRGYGHLNHIAYTSDSFESELARLRTEGMVPLGQPRKAKAFNGSRVVFFLTKLGFIIEVIEAS